MPQPNQRLKHERQLRGWSQGRLAEQIDVPDYYISRWERGEVLPSPFYQQKLCDLFGKTAEALGFLQPDHGTPLPETLRVQEGLPVPSADAETGPVSPSPILTDELPAQVPFSPPAESSSAPLPSSPHDHSPAHAESRSFPSTLPSMPTPLPPVLRTPSPQETR